MKHHWWKDPMADRQECVTCGMVLLGEQFVSGQWELRALRHCMPFTALFVGGPDHMRELVLEPPGPSRMDGYIFDRWVSDRYCEYVWDGAP